MSFATIPGPSGYSAPPRRNSNPILIILGVCGGCALVAVIAAVVLFVFVKQKAGSFLGRSVNAAQFAVLLQKREFDRAESFLTPQAQQTYPVSVMRKKLDALEAKNGPLTGVAQVQNIQPGQTDPNQIKDLIYNLNFQNGAVMPLTMGFDNTPGQETKIARLDWGNSDGADTEAIDEKPTKKKGARKGSAGNGSGE
jgi:hypothetical protein